MIRIDQAGRDHTELLDPQHWLSLAWNSSTRSCRGCTDCGGSGEPYLRCYGETTLDDARYGVSVCRDEDDLVDYLATTQADLTDTVLVELAGDYSDDDPEDADLGEFLILPTAIISVTPTPDEIIDRIHAKWEEMGL